MKKKFLVFFVATILFLSVALSAYAMDNVTNGVRNFVGGTENVVENAGNGIANGIKSGLNTVSGGTQNIVSDVKNGMENAGNSMVSTTDTNNNGYTATRTATDDVKIAGMTTNAWSWIIIGITAAAIILLVWSYIKQKNRDDIYIDSDKM